MDSPKNRLAQGGDVHLTDAEINYLRKEIAEQESLLKGYQIENERATENLREVQRLAKDRERILTEQNTALASQLTSLQAPEGLKLSNEESNASRTELLTLRTEILKAQTREAALTSENEKMKEVKKILENKLLDFEKIMKMQPMHTKDTSDTSCHCMLLSVNDSNCFLSSNPELKERTVDTGCVEVQSSEVHEKKEVIIRIDKKEETKVQNLQKRMQRMKGEYDLKLRHLKQQLEKKPVASQDRERASTRRVKELEEQINEVRSFYTKKLKEQAEKTAVKSVKRGQGRVVSAASKIDKMQNSGLVQAFNLSLKSVALLEENLKEKEAIIKHLEENILVLVRERGSKGYCTVETKIDESLNGPLEGETSPRFLKKGFGKRSLSVMQDRPDAPLKFQIGRAGTMTSSDRDNPSLSRESNDVPVAATNMNPQNIQISDFASPEHRADLKNSQAIKAPTSTTLQKTQEGMDNLVDLVQGIAMPSVVQSQQLQALQVKVLEMESRQRQRELELQSVLIETKRLLDEERNRAGRNWQLAMEAKNAEIKRFKLELDSILEIAIQMQRTHLNKI